MLRARKSVMMCETAPGTASGPLIEPTCIRTYDLMPIRTRPYRKKDTSFRPEGHVLVGVRTRPCWCIQADSGGTKQAGGKGAARLKCFLGEGDADVSYRQRSHHGSCDVLSVVAWVIAPIESFAIYAFHGAAALSQHLCRLQLYHPHFGCLVFFLCHNAL